MGVLEDALELHKRLAIRYKDYESTDGQLPPIVVLNEMRYALRAAIKLLEQASFEHLSDVERGKFDASSQEMHHALRNAYHDLVDGLLIQTTRMLESLLDKYPVAAVNVLGDRRLTILNDFNKIESLISKSRGDGENRNQIYEAEIYENWFQTISEHYTFIDQVALQQVITEHDRLSNEGRNRSRQFWLTIVLTIFGILISIIALFK